MRRLRWLVPIVAVLVSTVPVIAQGRAPIRERQPTGMALAPGDPAPTVEATRIDGREHSFDYDARDLTIVTFCASSIAACRLQMPGLQELYDEFPRDRLEVNAVLLEQTDPAAAAAFGEGLGISYPLIRPDTKFIRNWGNLRLLPATFLVKRDGTVLRRYVGSSPPELEGLLRDVRDFLAGRPLKTMVLPPPPAPSR